jgi:hypothetical protein
VRTSQDGKAHHGIIIKPSSSRTLSASSDDLMSLIDTLTVIVKRASNNKKVLGVLPGLVLDLKTQLVHLLPDAKKNKPDPFKGLRQVLTRPESPLSVRL